MRRLKRKTLLRIIIQKQLTSWWYFLAVFVCYMIVFYFASLALLLEALKFLWPAIVGWGIIVFINFLRAWLAYRQQEESNL